MSLKSRSSTGSSRRVLPLLLLPCKTHLQSPHPIDHGDHSVQPDIRVPLFVPPESLSDGSRISETCRLENDVVERSALSDHFLNGSETVVSRGAAEAAVGKSEEGSSGSASRRLNGDSSS